MSTARTSGYHGLRAYGSKTTVYVHDDRPSKTAQFMRVTGISPWDGRRFGISAWIFVLLLVLGQSEPLGWALVAMSAAVVMGVKIRKSLADRPAPSVRSVPPGPAWCDHCADWTVHATEQH